MTAIWDASTAGKCLPCYVTVLAPGMCILKQAFTFVNTVPDPVKLTRPNSVSGVQDFFFFFLVQVIRGGREKKEMVFI